MLSLKQLKCCWWMIRIPPFPRSWQHCRFSLGEAIISSVPWNSFKSSCTGCLNFSTAWHNTLLAHSSIALTAASLERKRHTEDLLTSTNLKVFTEHCVIGKSAIVPLKGQGVVSEYLWDNTPCFESQASALNFNFCVLTELCSAFVGLSNNGRSFSGSRERVKEGNTDAFQRTETERRCLLPGY